jgi:hypothetical protein
MPVADLTGCCRPRPRPERMNSPLEIREVRLRGLPRRGAPMSTGATSGRLKPRSQSASARDGAYRSPSGGFSRSSATRCPAGADGTCRLFPIPYSLFPIPYSLFPIPYSLFPIPIPYSLFPT